MASKPPVLIQFLELDHDVHPLHTDAFTTNVLRTPFHATRVPNDDLFNPLHPNLHFLWFVRDFSYFHGLVVSAIFASHHAYRLIPQCTPFRSMHHPSHYPLYKRASCSYFRLRQSCYCLSKQGGAGRYKHLSAMP